jgi:hypothetical protein
MLIRSHNAGWVNYIGPEICNYINDLGVEIYVIKEIKSLKPSDNAMIAACSKSAEYPKRLINLQDFSKFSEAMAKATSRQYYVRLAK